MLPPCEWMRFAPFLEVRRFPRLPTDAAVPSPDRFIPSGSNGSPRLSPHRLLRLQNLHPVQQ